jgi:SAM-dependent methyltransferase
VTSGRRDHWERVWRERAPDELSWHQDSAALSFSLVTATLGRPDAPIIDVGGGDSPLTGELLRYGFFDLTVLDISSTALAAGRQRLGGLAGAVTWIEADVTRFEPARRYELWHDRAVFHFLTEPADRRRYLDAASRSVGAAGWLIIGTFAPDGPESCSGLPVERYSPDSLADAVAPAFVPVDFRTEQHVTPAGAAQSFLYGRFRRSDERAAPD